MSFPAVLVSIALAIGLQTGAEVSRDSGPKLVRASTTRVSPSTVLGLWGENLYSPKEPHFTGIRIVFEQERQRFEEKICGGTGNPGFDEGPNYCLEVNVPEGLELGPCRVHVERDGFRSETLVLEVVDWEPPLVDGLGAETIPRTGDVSLEGAGFHTNDELEIVDSAGAVFRVQPGLHSFSEGQVLPEKIALGPARVRALREDDHDGPSTAWFDFTVVDGPEPLELSDGWMQPAAPGQWIEVVPVSERASDGADRAELLFEQNSRPFVAECSIADTLRVQIPKNLAAGEATVRGRTWRAGVASEWSNGIPYTVLGRPAVPEVTRVYAHSASGRTHLAEPGSDELVLDFQDDIDVFGRFPDDATSVLVAVFESESARFEIACEQHGGFLLRVPTASTLPPGRWTLVLVRRADGLRTPTPLHIVVASARSATDPDRFPFQHTGVRADGHSKKRDSCCTK